MRKSRLETTQICITENSQMYCLGAHMFLCSHVPQTLQTLGFLYLPSFGCLLCVSPVVDGCKESRENSRKLVGRPVEGGWEWGRIWEKNNLNVSCSSLHVCFFLTLLFWFPFCLFIYFFLQKLHFISLCLKKVILSHHWLAQLHLLLGT